MLAIVSGPLLAAAVPDVPLDTGTVSGASGLKSDVRAYKRIPFAAPPIGNLRWRAPQPAAHWSTVRNGDHFAPICPQKTDDPRSIYFLDPGSQTISEDCLYLNAGPPRAPLPRNVRSWLDLRRSVRSRLRNRKILLRR